MPTPSSPLTHPSYRPDIDGLRAVAVLAVVGFHAFPSRLTGGFTGVDVFFVISGFLISTILFENLDRGSFRFAEFYARRVRRLFPALAVVMLACLTAGWFLLLADEFTQLGKHVAAGAGFVANLVLWSEAGYFDNSAETKPLLHLWSLGVEEQFYAIWPLFVWFAWKRNFNVLTLTILVLLLSFYLNLKGVKQTPVAVFYSPQTRFWELLCGSALAWLTIYQKPMASPWAAKLDQGLSQIFYRTAIDADGRTLANCCAWLGCFLLGYGFWQIHTSLRFPGTWALLPVLGAVLLIFAGPMAWFNRRILANKIVVWFGLISFPLYLWHWPLLSFARIVVGEVPNSRIRIGAVLVAIVLSWLTMRFIEKPFRFSHHYVRLKIATLCAVMTVIALSGWLISRTDFTHLKGYEKLAIKRKGFEHAFGSSLAWYRGKGDWLFLGNNYDKTVAKLKLAITPSPSEIDTFRWAFAKLAEAGSHHNTALALIVAPNKSSVYPEYLPDELIPSTKTYRSFFLDSLAAIPNLTVYDPTSDFLASKHTEGLLYWMTDTHWNAKGAYLAYRGFAKRLGLPAVSVTFQLGKGHRGDLVEISKQHSIPMHIDDDWEAVFPDNPRWREYETPNEPLSDFGKAAVVINAKPLVNKSVWVIGDSFTRGLRPYLNATFKTVRYVGHWNNTASDLPSQMAKADSKPDLILVVRVERLF